MTWDDYFVRSGAVNRLAHLAPAAVVYYGLPLVPRLGGLASAGQSVAAAYMVFPYTTLNALLNFYRTLPSWESRPIKGYVQVIKIGIYIVGAILVMASLMHQSPLVFLSGIGAMTAVLMLVFKDTILSVVASVQIAMNDIVRVGDWIEMPQYNADGDVIDIALYTVTVQNWDKTVSTIPTYKIIQEPLKNWRTMPESGGRRVKRALYIDKSSIRFLSDDEVERFKRFQTLAAYIDGKQRELREANLPMGSGDGGNVNARRLTNVGTFRAYVEQFLRLHPKVNQNLTLLVRQLQPGPTGLPIELYFFTSDTAWGSYESIQADVFDHLMAMVPEFGLQLYQQPSGLDVKQIGVAHSA